MKASTLLEIDGLGNVLLGLPLIIYPTGVARLLRRYRRIPEGQVETSAVLVNKR